MLRLCSGYPGIHVVAPSSEGSGTTTDRCAAPLDVEGGLSKTLAGRRRGTPVDGRDKPDGVDAPSRRHRNVPRLWL